MKYRGLILTALLLSAFIVVFLWMQSRSHEIAIKPPVEKLPKSFILKIDLLTVPLQFHHDSQITNVSPPEWLQVQIPTFAEKIPRKRYSDFYSREYIDKYGKSLEEGAGSSAFATFFYGVYFATSDGEYMISVLTLGKTSEIPQNKSNLLSMLQKRIQGKWLIYPSELVSLFTYLPWQDLKELQLMSRSGRATMGSDQRLKAVD